MARDSFVFYRSFFEAIKRMPIEVQTEVYPALIEYALDSKEPKGLSDIAQGVFILVKPNIDASIARKENGKKFGKLGVVLPRKARLPRLPSLRAKPLHLRLIIRSPLSRRLTR